MPSIPPFNLPGRWYRGNLHAHSTQTDGEWSPQVVMDWYARHGYDFLCISDHDRVVIAKNFGSPPLFMLPGAEISARQGEVNFHLLAFGIQEMPPLPHGILEPQAVIDAVRREGGLVFVAHPYWSDLLPTDLLALTGYHGIEVYNANCWLEINKGNAEQIWDALLRRGPMLWGLAADDAHARTTDYGGGWIMLHSERLDQTSLLAALAQGHFYASSGPEIYDIDLTGDWVRVRCSPARSVYVLGPYRYSPDGVHAWPFPPGEQGLSDLAAAQGDDQLLTEVTLRLDQRQEIFRVVVVDNQGRAAWSQPAFRPDPLP